MGISIPAAQIFNELNSDTESLAHSLIRRNGLIKGIIFESVMTTILEAKNMRTYATQQKAPQIQLRPVYRTRL